MHLMRDSWADARLDDFAANVYRRLDGVEAELKALNRTLLQVGGGVIAALLGILATQL
jgi:hypothetical protein